MIVSDDRSVSAGPVGSDSGLARRTLVSSADGSHGSVNSGVSRSSTGRAMGRGSANPALLPGRNDPVAD